MLDVEQLLGKVAPRDACQPVQVVAGHVELGAGWFKGSQLGELLLNDLRSCLGNLIRVRLQTLTESGGSTRGVRIAVFASMGDVVSL